MPDALVLALATPGLGWMLATIMIAGMVRGFTGFGTALVFVPIGTLFLPMADVVLLMALTGMLAAVAMVPSCWTIADKPEVAALALAATVTVPVGLWLLVQLDPVVLRWLAILVIGATLGALLTGWRWEGRLRWPGRLAIGGAAGTIGGMTGLTGPVVIVFYLANARDISRVRANTVVFLALLDSVIVANLILSGRAGADALRLTAVLGLPYLAGTLIGKAVFDPRRDSLYRAAAYSVIGLAVITGLPLFD